MDAIQSVTLKAESMTGAIDERGIRTYGREYVVKTASRHVGAATVRGAAALPQWGQTWSYGGTTSLGQFTEADTGAHVISIDARLAPGGDKTLWFVSVRYASTSPDPNAPADPEASPLDDPAIITWRTELFERQVTTDLDGKVYEDSAGNVAGSINSGAPAVVIDDARLSLGIQKNYAGFNTAFIRPYINAINADTFMGEAPRTLKISKLDATNAYRNGVAYVQVLLEMHSRPEGWQPRILNHAPGYLDASGEWQVQGKPGGGLFEFYLGLDGKKLNGNGHKPADPAQVTYRSDFRGYREISFSTLNI